MTQSSNDNFSEDELATLRLLEAGNPQEDTRDGTGEDDDDARQQAAADATREQTAATVNTPAATTATTTTDEPIPADRAALRAARRSERRALQEKDRLQAELDALRAAGGNPAANPGTATDDDLIAALEIDFPSAAEALRSTNARIAAVTADLEALRGTTTATTTERDDDYVPQILPDNVQDAVDTLPTLLAWQTNKADLDKWELAKQADNLLRASPKWADKPMAERLAEAVRRVEAELDLPSPTTTTARRDPAAVIANVRRDAPTTLSDLRGGVADTTTQALSRADMERMNDDELMRALG